MRRPVPPKELVLLWARAAGMCSHPDCKRRLVMDPSGDDDRVSIGHVAHIVARSDRGPRGMPAAARNRYENLILLCPTCHNTADLQPGTHPPDLLRAWKAEHESWIFNATSPAQTTPWTAILQDADGRIDRAEAFTAIGPASRIVAVEALSASPSSEGFSQAAELQRTKLERLLIATPAERRRFAVFSLAPIPLAVHLGFVLSDRARVALFHYDRDRGTWQWPPPEAPAQVPPPLTVKARRTGNTHRIAAIRVSLSATVTPGHIADIINPDIDVEISVEHPSVRWLQQHEQLTGLARAFEQALAEIRSMGQIDTIHLFYAGPAAGAVTFGRAYNPRMNPALLLYEHHAGENPCYSAALPLNP
jgi:hypothetical protein